MVKKLTLLLTTFIFASFVFAQTESVEIKDNADNPLITINDEGTAGSITLPSVGSALGSGKLYNDGSDLFWGSDQVTIAKTYSVGAFAQGGHIIEVTPNGKHGIVAALTNQATGVSWYESNNDCNNSDEHSTSGKEYKNWRVPTERELNLIYDHRVAIDATAAVHGGSPCSSDYYWSSTEYDNEKAWTWDFIMGAYNWDFKNGLFSIRSVRVF